jgi:hypothetical protein
MIIKFRLFIKRILLKSRVTTLHQMLQLYKKPIIKMQAIIKARYYRKTYLNLKTKIKIIQKTYRTYLNKKKYLSIMWKK